MGASVITMAMVREAARACRRASDARKQAEACEADKTITLLTVLEPLLGIASEAELKRLSLSEVLRTAKRRIASGAVKLHNITPERLCNAIELVATRRNVAWKETFISEVGEARAQAVIENTAESYS